MKENPQRRRYTPPRVRTQIPEKPAVLLVCTGYPYNCINELGYDCCVSIPDECFTQC